MINWFQTSGKIGNIQGNTLLKNRKKCKIFQIYNWTELKKKEQEEHEANVESCLKSFYFNLTIASEIMFVVYKQFCIINAKNRTQNVTRKTIIERSYHENTSH